MKKKHFYGKRRRYDYSYYVRVDKIEVGFGAKTLKELFQIMAHTKKIQEEDINEKTN